MAVTEPLLDRRALRQGAAVTILIAVPAAVLIRLLKSSDLVGQESNWWVVGVGLVLVGFIAGGYRAARHSPDALPLSHAAAGAALAFALMIAGSAVAAVAGGTHIGQAFVFLVVLMALLCVSAAVIGGYVAVRRADRRRR